MAAAAAVEVVVGEVVGEEGAAAAAAGVTDRIKTGATRVNHTFLYYTLKLGSQGRAYKRN